MDEDNPEPDNSWLSEASLIPAKSTDKRPAIPSWKEYQSRRPTPEETEKWNREIRPTAWAFICGKVSGGIYVVDADSVLAEHTVIGRWMRYLGPTKTVCTSGATPGEPDTGKRHYYFRDPNVGKTVSWTPRAKELDDILVPPVDLKAEGGYVLAPGSKHPSGTIYTVVDESDVKDVPYETMRHILELIFRHWPLISKILPSYVTGTRTFWCGNLAAYAYYHGFTEEDALILVRSLAYGAIDPLSTESDAFNAEQAVRSTYQRAASGVAVGYKGEGGPQGAGWPDEMVTEIESLPEKTRFPKGKVEQEEERMRARFGIRETEQYGQFLDEDATSGGGGSGETMPPASSLGSKEPEMAGPPVAPSETAPARKKKKTASREQTERSSAEYTDSGNAERFADRFKDELRYIVETNRWVVWDGMRWKIDHSGVEAQDRAEEAAREFMVIAAQSMDKEAIKWGLSSLNTSRINATIELSRHRFTVSLFDFDKDPMLLNCESGTIDLRTGTERPHSKDDMITSLVPHRFNKDAKCQRWIQFLKETQPNIPIEYKQRFYGYAATGENKERKFEIRQGKSGKNGKSTEKNVVMHVLGSDFTIEIPVSTFIEAKRDYKGDDLVDLKSKRLVFASEPARGVVLNVSMLKHIVGRDEIRCRPLHSNQWVRFIPKFKIVIITNPELRIYDLDDPIWDRLLLIPYNVEFPEEKQDKNLEAALNAEAEGILAWIVEGARQWNEGGLRPPESVRIATNTYRESQDIIGEFTKHFRTTKLLYRDGRGLEIKTGAFPIQSSALYAVYETWCDQEGHQKLGNKRFAEELERLGYIKVHRETGAFWLTADALPSAENLAVSRILMEKNRGTDGTDGSKGGFSRVSANIEDIATPAISAVSSEIPMEKIRLTAENSADGKPVCRHPYGFTNGECRSGCGEKR